MAWWRGMHLSAGIKETIQILWYVQVPHLHFFQPCAPSCFFHLIKQPLPRCSQPCHAWRQCKPHVRSPRRTCRSPLIIDVFLSYSSLLTGPYNSEPTWNESTTLSGRVIWDSVSHVSHLDVPSKLFLMNPASSLHISSKSPSFTHFHPGDSSTGPFSF
ncbi:uncharacterized protein F5891DRAFT_297327 [Suillus fuscotomentosus]|uniref:Uncharacterized protein n=1 Tax=Suillus fuscotomentosus TaxID=1912939 RepID=A0AAD4HLG3_9AGAM|nr:uncharacterized protein F5891DRAFT_297327 [Suillus fuscotomentosus]KAG1900536.1 hypothetical protein F5891DRAFT_297327 [Suillus fuscotomentosus]